MIHVIYGEDEFSCREALKALRESCCADQALASLNCTVLDGRRLTLGELHHHCDAIPFLSERRMVIVEGLVSRLAGKGAAKRDTAGAEESEAEIGSAAGIQGQLLEYLESVPESTDLVLYDPGFSSKGRRSRLLKWARAATGKASVKEYPKLGAAELKTWAKKRIEDGRGKIEGQALTALTWQAGDDTGTLAGEIEKLLLFKEQGQEITLDDVRRLVVTSREANIFAIVDAISEKKWARAIAELRMLLDEGLHPLYVLTMIHRQFGLILQANDLAGERLRPNELARRLSIHEFTAGKVIAQASRYNHQKLAAIYERLIETDLGIKTGRIEGPLALELFISDLMTI